MYSLTLTDSLLCISYLHDHEKSHDEKAGEISLGVVVAAARDFFHLMTNWKGFLGMKELDDPCQEIVPAQSKHKFMASLTNDETLICGEEGLVL
ncbi:hypothetical protein ACJRO7_020654 [Eucalyptus globulus]|uniref:Uncharacterized protein n=1 Tax=Eucalyptus globulus TaxID=34317 RepID=A0ABD3KNZ4_EUCGL